MTIHYYNFACCHRLCLMMKKNFVVDSSSCPCLRGWGIVLRVGSSGWWWCSPHSLESLEGKSKQLLLILWGWTSIVAKNSRRFEFLIESRKSTLMYVTDLATVSWVFSSRLVYLIPGAYKTDYSEQCTLKRPFVLCYNSKEQLDCIQALCTILLCCT